MPHNLTLSLGHERLWELLNALYGSGGGVGEGASAVKQAVSRLLSVPVNYHALVTLRRFADLVDAPTGFEALTVTFGPDYVCGRRKKGNYPAPNDGRSAGW